MIEHKYIVCKSNWAICITIFAEYTDYENVEENSKAIKVADGLWLKFESKPIARNDVFGDDYVPSLMKGWCDDYLSYLIKGLEIVQKQIINNSIHKSTLIIINSLNFSICDFQEEGLTAAIIEWASKAFDFAPPIINVCFQKENNRYVFDFA